MGETNIEDMVRSTIFCFPSIDFTPYPEYANAGTGLAQPTITTTDRRNYGTMTVNNSWNTAFIENMRRDEVRLKSIDDVPQADVEDPHSLFRQFVVAYTAKDGGVALGAFADHLMEFWQSRNG